MDDNEKVKLILLKMWETANENEPNDFTSGYAYALEIFEQLYDTMR